MPDMQTISQPRDAMTMQRMLDRMTDGIIAVDQKGQITFANAAAAAMAGKAPVGLSGKPLEVVLELTGGLAQAMREQRETFCLLELPSFGRIRVRIYPGPDGATLRLTRHVQDAFGRAECEHPEGTSCAVYQRMALLSAAASQLLANRDKQQVVNTLCRQVMAGLNCDVFFNFLVDETRGKLRMNTCSGIPDDIARKIEWLEYGVAVCGCVARDGVRIIAEDIQHTPDPRTELVKSFGVQAYCCHPLISRGHVIGTLSFGTCRRPTFSADEVELMRSVAALVAIGMERLQMEEAELRSHEEVDQAKNEFLAVLSHELRTPLTVMLGWTEMAQKRRAPEFLGQAMDVITRNVRRQQRLVDELIDMSMLINQRFPLQRETVDLARIALLAIEEHREEAYRKEIVLTSGSNEGPLSAIGDPRRLRQCISYLLDNSLKFTPPGGVVSVCWRQEGSQAMVTVQDNGRGIAKETLPLLFQPFRQIERDEATGGLGLGLAIMRGIVELHGGNVIADSAGAGQGSTFTIVLPLLPDQERSAE